MTSTLTLSRWVGADIPHVATVKEDQLFRVETIDWTGGQIKDDDNSDDIKFVDLRSGP
jgi:formamidase